MTLIQKVGILATSATIASSTGAYLSYSSTSLVEEQEIEEVKPEKEPVWASFKNRSLNEGKKLPEDPLGWF